MTSVKRILLVEDEVDLRTNLAELLEIEKYTVFPAENGQQALDLLGKFDIDLIISDILMPEINGYELLQKIRANLNYVNLPLIFLSAKVSKKEIRRGMEDGADDYLTKPINAIELFNAVKTVFNKKDKREAWANQRVASVVNEERNVRYHELRTPLFGVLSILELLHEDLLSADAMPRELQLDWIEKAFFAAKRLNKSLIKLILFQEHSSLGSPQKKKLSLFETLHDLRDSSEVLPEFSIRWSDCIVEFDPVLLNFLIRELLENAGKFGVSTEPISVIGEKNKFSFKNKQQLFDHPYILCIRPFFQHNRAYLEQQGLGLGLFLAQHYCTLNGAVLQAEVDANLDFVVTVTF